MQEDKPMTYTVWMVLNNYWGGKPARSYYQRLYGLYVRDFMEAKNKKAPREQGL